MNKKERTEALAWLGECLFELEGLESAIHNAGLANPFFTEEFCRLSLAAIRAWLKPDLLSEWMAGVPASTGSPKTAGLIMAGNLPLVGWHDLMCIFATGNRCRYKPSSQDSILPDFLVDSIIREFPAAAALLEKSDQMKGVDAIIATGSNASAVHFHYYFRHIPRLIRGSRSSLGFIYGFESSDELSLLCDDVMQYFGMGCRSITKLLVPEGYEFGPFFEALEKYRYLTGHHRFQNNAIYHKAIFLMNGDPFLENDILILRENPVLFSPPGVLHYQFYKNLEEAHEIVRSHRQDLQCMVSHQAQFPGSIPFGTAQKPGLSDYADGADTLKFLLEAFPEN
jgi:hypothetical protein